MGGSSPLCLHAGHQGSPARAAPGLPRSTAFPIRVVWGPRRGRNLRPVRTSLRDPRPTSRCGEGSRRYEGRMKECPRPFAFGHSGGGQASAGSLRACCPGRVRLPDSGSMNPSPLLREQVTGCKWIPSNPRDPAQARLPRGGGSRPPGSHPECQLAFLPPRGNSRRGQSWPGTWRETERQQPKGCQHLQREAVTFGH